MSAVGDVRARRARLLHRVHILLGREKQHAIVRVRFQALIDGLREFSNDNQGVQVFGFDAVQGTTAADRSPHWVRPVVLTENAIRAGVRGEIS